MDERYTDKAINLGFYGGVTFSGYSVVEMKCASMAACAKMRGVLFGQVLFTADSLAKVDAYDIRNWGNDFFAAAMKIAMEAITEV